MIDKKKAKKHKYRISEMTLLLSGLLGGALGGLISMNVNHHKTKKWKFRILMPLFLILWIYIIYKIQLLI